MSVDQPVLRVDDGVDEGVVDGGGFGNDSRHRFGVGTEVAPVTERGR